MTGDGTAITDFTTFLCDVVIVVYYEKIFNISARDRKGIDNKGEWLGWV